MSGTRIRRRVEDDAAKEEPWTLAAYEWDPISCVAHKKRNLGPVGELPSDALEVVPAPSLDSELGLLADDTGIVNATLLQQQIANAAATPQLTSLPVLDTTDRADAEPATVCEVLGCGASLEGLKRYYVRMRVCEHHLHASALLVNGVVSRFCQQCARFHFVGEFSGNKKSCIATLERHNARHRAKVLARLQEQMDAESDGKGKARARKRAAAAKRRAAQPRTGPALVPMTPAHGQAVPARPETSGANDAADGLSLGVHGLVFLPATCSPVAHGGGVGGSGGAQSSLEVEAAPSATSPHPPALGWDGATSGWAAEALPARPLVTTGGNAIVSMDERPPSRTPSTGPPHAPALLSSTLPQQPTAAPPSLPQWPAGTPAGWESCARVGNATGAPTPRAPLPPVPYDVHCALGAMQEQLQGPPSAEAPTARNMYSSDYGSVGSMAQPAAFVSDAGDGVIARSGSAPSPRSTRSGKAADMGAGDVWGDAAIAVGDVSHSTQIGGSASGTTDSVSQATARQALMAHHSTGAAAGSSGLNQAACRGVTPEPCVSSGDAGGILAAVSPACSLTEGVSATRASGSGISDIYNDGASGDVAARITRIFQELGPLLEQYRQHTAFGSDAVATHSALAAASDGLPIATGSGGPSSSTGALRSPASAGATVPAAGGQDRAGSSSLPPMSDAVLAMMSQASQLTAGLQASMLFPWTITSGVPTAPFPTADSLGTIIPVPGTAGMAPGSGHPPPHRSAHHAAASPSQLLAPGPVAPVAMPTMAPALLPQSVPGATTLEPGWRQLTSHPGVMVNAAVVRKPPGSVHSAALPPHQQLPVTASASAALPHPSLHSHPPMAPTSALPSPGSAGGTGQPPAGAMLLSGSPLAPSGLFPPTATPQSPSPVGTPGSSLNALQPHESASWGKVHPAALSQMPPHAAAAGPVALSSSGSDPACAGPLPVPAQHVPAADLSGLEVDDDLLELLSCLDEPEGRVEKEWEAAQHQAQHNAATTAHQMVAAHQRHVQTAPYGEQMGGFAWHPNPHGPPLQPPVMYGALPQFAAGPAQYGVEGYAPGPQGGWGFPPAATVPVVGGVRPGVPNFPAPGCVVPVAGVHEELDDVDPRELTRVSLKVMNVLPHELPPNVRSNLRRWLREARVEALQATLRPGCLQLVVDVRHKDPANPVDLASALIPTHDAEEAAVDVFRIMGQRLKDTYVQVDRSVLQIRVGERPVVLSWEEAAEDGGLDGAKYPTLAGCSVAAVCAGSDAVLQLSGRHLAQTHIKAFARLRGHDVPAVLLPPSSDAGSEGSKDVVRMSVRVPAGAVGLMVVEVGVGHLLGGWWQVLVLPRGRARAADELRRLRQEEGEERREVHEPAARQAEGGSAAAGGPGRRQPSGGFWRLLGDLSVVLEVLSDATAADAAADAAAGATSTSAGSPTAAGSPNTATTPCFSALDAVGASTVSASDAGTTTASVTEWSYGGRTDTLSGSVAGSSLASFATAASTGRLAPVVPPAVPARAPGQAVHTPHHVGPAATAAVSGSRHIAPTVVVPAPPRAAALQTALARACRLLRFTVARGLPHLTALLLPAALRLARFAAESRVRTQPAHAAHSLAAAVSQQLAAHGAGTSAPLPGPGSSTSARGLMMTAGADPQALLPLAVVSGSTATVDVLSTFAVGELGAPLQMHLPQGPTGLPPLHLAALLDDGGAMSRHLLATQPWAAWAWVSLGWTPPGAGEGVAGAAPKKEESAATASDRQEATDVDGDGAERQEEEEEEKEDEEERAVSEPVRLTPGSLCVLLGRKELLRQAASMLIARALPRVGNAGGRDQGAEGAAMMNMLIGAVEAWGRTGCALLSILCEQLARQKL